MTGNKKPAIIDTVEKLIWNTIFVVARGKIDLLQGVENLAESFPWLEVEAESQNEWVRYWFDGPPDPEAAASMAMSLPGEHFSLLPLETNHSTEISAGDLEGGVNATDAHVNVGSSLDNAMDIDPSQPEATLRTPPVSPSSLRTPLGHGTPEIVPLRQPLFLPDPDSYSDEERLPIHLVRQALFSGDFPSMEFDVFDNLLERHLIRITFWVSGHLRASHHL